MSQTYHHPKSRMEHKYVKKKKHVCKEKLIISESFRIHDHPVNIHHQFPLLEPTLEPIRLDNLEPSFELILRLFSANCQLSGAQNTSSFVGVIENWDGLFAIARTLLTSVTTRHNCQSSFCPMEHSKKF